MTPNLGPFNFFDNFATGVHLTGQQVFMRDNVPACTSVPTPRRDVQYKTNHQHRNLQGEA